MVLLQEAHEEFGKRAVLGRISARILTQAIYCWQGQFGTAAAEDPWPKGQVDCDLGGGRIYGLAIGVVGARAGARGGLLRSLHGLLLAICGSRKSHP